MGPALHFWGFLMDRIDARIAVSPRAAESAARWLPGEYRIIPNGVLVPDEADPADRDHAVVFIGRHDPRKGLPMLLRAWPRDPRATGARLRLIGTDPLQYRLLHSRLRFDEDGHRRARHRHERGAHSRAQAREAVGVAGTRRRELRPGAGRGVRVRDAGGRLEHPRLCRCRDRRRRRCWCRRATSTRSPPR